MREIIEDYFKDKNTIITAAAGNGASSLCLFAANILANSNDIIVYFDPMDSIDRNFIKEYYHNVYNNVLFVACCAGLLLKFLQYIEYRVDYLILDPADCLLYNYRIIPLLSSRIRGHLICTSQIRQDPSKGGQIYSTLENKYMGTIFNNSVWIRNVTESNNILNRKYVDVFTEIRKGNNFSARYLANFTKEGNILS